MKIERGVKSDSGNRKGIFNSKVTSNLREGDKERGKKGGPASGEIQTSNPA